MPLSKADTIFRQQRFSPGVQLLRPRAAHKPYYKQCTNVTVTPASVVNTAPVNTVVGAIAVVQSNPPGKTYGTVQNDTFTYVLTNSAGGLFKIVGSNLQVAAALTAGAKTIAIQATGVNTGISKTVNIVITVT